MPTDQQNHDLQNTQLKDLIKLNQAIHRKLHFISICILIMTLIAIAVALEHLSAVESKVSLIVGAFLLLAYLCWPSKPQ